MASHNCPAREELSEFAVGRLSEESSGHIAAHLETCAKCEEAVTSLNISSDSLVAQLRVPPAENRYTGEPEYQQALVAVKRLGREPRTADRREPPAGERLDIEQLRDYQLLEKLGEGGMGAVYKALHTRLDKLVAVKVLAADRLKDPLSLARFEREMKAVGRLEHPHIVRATDAGDADGLHFLVMELVQGIDLSRLAKRLGPLPFPDACELIRQAAVGLQHAFEHGLVHRDIKPSNLMLAEERNSRADSRGESSSDPSSLGPQPASCCVKLLDLGLALLEGPAPADGGELTSTGQVMGTVDYMAPEQATDSHLVDIRADIYSLGVTFFKLLAGQLPFAGHGMSPIAKLTTRALNDAPSIGEFRSDLPNGLVEIVDRMLSRAPDARFDTPGEVAAVLAPYSTGADLPRLLAATAETSPADEGILRDPTVVCAASESVETLPMAAPSRTGQAAIAGSPGGQDPGDGDAAAGKRDAARGSLRRPIRAAAAAIFAAILLAATMIVVMTDTGTITVTSYDPSLEIVIKRGGKTVDEFEIQRGPKHTTYRSGEYEIEISGGTPDGTMIKNGVFTLTRGEDKLVEIVRRSGGARRELLPLAGHTDHVRRLEMLPDGKHLISSGKDTTLRCWDLETRTTLWINDKGPTAFYGFAVSPDSSLIAGGKGREVQFLNSRTGEILHSIPVAHDAYPRGFVFSPDGTTLIAGGNLGHLAIIDVQKGKVIEEYQFPDFPGPGMISSVAFLPDGRRYVIAPFSNGGKIYLRELGRKEPLREFRWSSRYQPTEVAVIDEGRKLLVVGFGPALIFDLETGEELRRVEFPVGAFRLARLSDGRHAVAGAWGENSGKTLLGLDLHTLEIVGQVDLDVVASEKVAVSEQRGVVAHSGSGTDNRILFTPLSALVPGVDRQHAPAPVGHSGAADAKDYALDLSQSDNETPPYADLPMLITLKAPFTIELYATPRSACALKEHRPILNLYGLFELKQFVDHWVWVATGDPPQRDMLTSAETVEIGRRTHLAGVSTGKELLLFVNGRLQGRHPLVVQFPFEKKRGFLGLGNQYASDRYNNFDGLIDDVRISNVARYDRDFTPPKSFGPDAQTLALYRCDEGSGETLLDSSGNGHDAQLVGAKWVHASESSAGPDDYDHLDRRVAEWILEQGGTINGSADGKWLQNASRGSLPADGVLVLRQIGAAQDVSFTTERFKQIAGLRSFQQLYLYGSRGVTDEGLKHLQRLPLLALGLVDTDITDESLATIVQFGTLEQLLINGTGVTDEGVRQLAQLNGLRNLRITKLNLQRETVDFLRSALPQCQIESDYGTFEPEPVEGEPVRRFEGHTDRVAALAWLPAGRQFVSAAWDRVVRKWDAQTGKELLQYRIPASHSHSLNDVTVSPDGKTIAAAGSTSYVYLWDAETGENSRNIVAHGGTTSISSVAFSPDGTRLVIGKIDGRLYICDVGEEEAVAPFSGADDIVFALAFLPDGRRFVAAYGGKPLVILWDAENKKELRRFERLEGHAWGVYDLALSADGNRLVTVGGDTTVRMWDMDTGDLLRRFEGHEDGVYSVSFLNDDRQVLTGGFDKTIRLWDVETGEQLCRFTTKTYGTTLTAVSPDGEYAVGGGGWGWPKGELDSDHDYGIRLWRLPGAPAD